MELDVAASGSKVIGIGARHAERVSFALGAEPQRVQWAFDQVARALSEGAPMPSLGPLRIRDAKRQILENDLVARPADRPEDIKAD